MKLGIVILNWNSSDDTTACIKSIHGWDTVTLTLNLVIVDNHSDANDVAQLRGWADVTLIENSTNLGFAGGTNKGIQACLGKSCDYVLLLNNDAGIGRDAVISLVKALDEHPTIGVIGPVIDTDRGQALAGGRDIAKHSKTHLRYHSDMGQMWDVDYVPGTVALVRKEVFDTIGLLDEDYFFSGEMADLCDRACKSGFRSVIDSRSRAFHATHRSERLRSMLHPYYTLRNRFLFVRKRRPQHKLRYLLLWSLIGLLKLTRALIRLDLLMARVYWLGLSDGLTGRVGEQNDRVLGSRPL